MTAESAIAKLRRKYHRNICERLIFSKTVKTGELVPNMADVGNGVSIALSRLLVERLQYPMCPHEISGQTAGTLLEQSTREFLDEAFQLLQHIRPGHWQFSAQGISGFDQYAHLAHISQLVAANPDLGVMLGDYLVKPDIVIAKFPVDDAQINEHAAVVGQNGVAKYTPLRSANASAPSLHASISCKWTIRSDRSQNSRTEGLNLIRNRKGHTPHITVVTGEPLPSRLASIAMGTGDIDCIYHFALTELIEAAEELGNEAVTDELCMLVNGRRLRDVADMPFDLVI